MFDFYRFKKAFDTVDHSILLKKLNHYGVRAKINEWFSSYLSERTPITQVGSEVSDNASILCEHRCMRENRSVRLQMADLQGGCEFCHGFYEKYRLNFCSISQSSS